jgi:hypothetical protein
MVGLKGIVMAEKSVTFGYGALCEPLEVQANKQGYTLGENAEKFEELREARLNLVFGDLLTDSQIQQTAQKLQKQVVKALQPLKENGGKINAGIR